MADAQTAAATRDAHRADIEAALLAANGALERARGDVVRGVDGATEGALVGSRPA